MATDAANVRVGFDGALYYAEKNEGLVIPGAPTGAAGAFALDDSPVVLATPTIPAGFTDVGFISSDGLTFGRSTEFNEIKAWQKSAIVRKALTSADLTLQFTMIETNKAALGLFFGSAPVDTGVDPDAYSKISESAPTPMKYAFCLDVIDGDGLYRCVVPNGEITEQGEVVISENETGYQVTITAYPSDAAGVKAIHYWSAL